MIPKNVEVIAQTRANREKKRFGIWEHVGDYGHPSGDIQAKHTFRSVALDQPDPSREWALVATVDPTSMPEQEVATMSEQEVRTFAVNVVTIKHLVEAFEHVARVNHYMVGVVNTSFSDQELDAAEQILIGMQNDCKQQGQRYKLLERALGLIDDARFQRRKREAEKISKS